MYKVKFANIMEMLYSFWSDKILVGILKKVCCNNAVVSNILNVFFACFLLFSTLTVMNVHSIIKLLSHWKVTFGFELFYCTRNYSGVNSFVKFYIIHFSMISNVCWHQIKIFSSEPGLRCFWPFILVSFPTLSLHWVPTTADLCQVKHLPQMDDWMA